MHFIAMLAFSIPEQISYDFWWTFGSMILAVLATAGGYALISFGSLQPSRLLLAGVITGTGVAAMHYAGMSAMVVQATITYDRTLFLLSIAIAITAATVALWLSFRLEGAWHKLGASVVMGGAIAGMHFTGMSAASFALCLTDNPTATGIDPRLLAVSRRRHVRDPIARPQFRFVRPTDGAARHRRCRQAHAQRAPLPLSRQ
jgi:NO-binding membrane sensor protein with MHYT domain